MFALCDAESFVPGGLPLASSFAARRHKNMAAALVLTCVSRSNFELHFDASSHYHSHEHHRQNYIDVEEKVKGK